MVAELDNAKVCHQECMGRLVADYRECIGKGRVLKRSPLGADAHPDPVPFCSPAKPGIYLFCTGMTPGHRRYEERRGEGTTQEPAAEVDCAHVTFRQGIVNEPYILKPGIAAFNLTFRTDAEVIELP
jgi:hypothetical protein